jgi:transposase
MPVIQPDAAGIDIGSRSIYVAVPSDRDGDHPVREFGAFTEDLHALAAWLINCRIRSVAMEATGVYWIPLFQILEGCGFEVCLVNGRHVKNVPGRKSDVQDCQWLQYLHAVGLLRGSFRPPDEVCAIRSLLRHRETLVSTASTHVQHMQKALTQMNLQLHHVISDITGKTGQLILDAVLAGERDPAVLAQYRDPRIKASEQTVAKSLVGDYRAAHLFALKQSFASYRHYQRQIEECDAELERLLATVDSCADPRSALPPARNPRAKTAGNPVVLPYGDLRTEMHRILGVDLSQVPGIQATSAHALFAELGPDLRKFPSAKHFCSWLGLCPDNRSSGGRVISARTRKVANRVANTLRLAAQALWHSDTPLGAFYRRMRTKLGAPKAITATAHRLARIIYHLLTTRQPYDETVFAQEEIRQRRRRLERLHREASQLGFELAPRPVVS